MNLPYLAPTIFLALSLLTPTSHDISKYILINVGRWSYITISINQLLYGVSGSIALILLLRTLIKSNYNITLLLGAISRAIESLINVYLLFCAELTFPLVFLLRFMATSFEILSDSLLMSSIQGRLYDIIPEGFESTGVAMTHLFHMFRVWSYQVDIF